MFRLFRIAAVVAAILGSVATATAQQTGTIAGVVKDSQGAVLPGATVTAASGALIGGSRSTVTGATGGYQITSLPPGLYTITYELSGFTTLTREQIRVQVATVTRLDVELAVGAIQEKVTVTGESPVVDTSSTVTQTNIDKDLYEAIPSGRNPWVMAGLVPGVVTGRLDVGGTQGMQQYNLEVFGSADSQKSFSIDGLKTNWPGGSGGATMQYYDFGMYEEYNFQTASGTAESDVAGVYMNMVTKSGGNRFSGDHTFYFMNDDLQGDNVDDDLRRRLGLRPGQATGAAGNPVDISYDWNSTVGGPIKTDRAWFFGAIRWWRLDQFQIGATNPDGSQAIDDNRIRNFMGRVTYQANQATKTSFMFNRNLKDRFHRRDPPFLFVDDKASFLQDQPAQNFVAQLNRVFGQAALWDVRFGRMWGVFPNRYQKEVGPNDIAIRDVVRFTRINAAEQAFENPNARFQFNTSLSYFKDNLLGGSHDFKVGVQISREKFDQDFDRNGDVLLELRDGVPFQAQLANTPVRSKVRMATWGAFVQDRWMVGRLTLNLGVRFDGVQGWVPAQSSPAGTFVGARNIEKRDRSPDWPISAAPRLGVSYDLRGNGQTALKAYYGRFYNQIGAEIPIQVNPNGFSAANVAWNDRNGNLRLDPGELGPFTGFVGGATTQFDADADRPYSDEFNVGIDHTLTRDLAVSVSYHRRQHRNGLGVLDRARPASAYTPVPRTYTDPITGQPASITIFNLDPALRAVRDRLITNVDVLKSDYDGVHFQITKKLSNRWQMLGGLTVQNHEGFWHDGTFTNSDFNDPNALLNRDDSAIFTDIPWVLTLSGSYLLPYDVMISAKYTARDGDPLVRDAVFAGLTQASATVLVAPRGTDRTETVSKFLDLRFAKRLNFGGARVEGTVDLFNVMNADHVLNQVSRVGATFGRPSLILTPRIIRVGATLHF